jgi:kinesin family protein 18/19
VLSPRTAPVVKGGAAAPMAARRSMAAEGTPRDPVVRAPIRVSSVVPGQGSAQRSASGGNKAAWR